MSPNPFRDAVATVFGTAHISTRMIAALGCERWQLFGWLNAVNAPPDEAWLALAGAARRQRLALDALIENIEKQYGIEAGGSPDV